MDCNEIHSSQKQWLDVIQLFSVTSDSPNAQSFEKPSQHLFHNDSAQTRGNNMQKVRKLISHFTELYLKPCCHVALRY